MDFEFGELEQGELSDEQYITKKVELYHTLYFFVGSDLFAAAIVLVLIEVHYLHMGFYFFVYCIIQ